MIKSEARLAWRLLLLNWLAVAAMGGVLLIAILFSRFSIAPATFLAMSGFSIELALIAYLYVRLKRDLADPKLVFALGGIAQLLMLVWSRDRSAMWR
jgi:hypothetical protein